MKISKNCIRRKLPNPEGELSANLLKTLGPRALVSATLGICNPWYPQPVPKHFSTFIEAFFIPLFCTEKKNERFFKLLSAFSTSEKYQVGTVDNEYCQ